MAEFINAAEAAARSSRGSDCGAHIERIMQKIRYACQHRDRKLGCYLVDCDVFTLEQVGKTLAQAGYKVECTPEGEDAWIYLEW